MNNRFWFGNASVSWEEFISSYWRKKPVHVSAASIEEHVNSQLADSLTTQNLLQLCQNELIESRLIDLKDGEYNLQFGPFELVELPQDSMLMVQGLESHLLVISDYLRHSFSFLPRWRIDDVMASYANENTSCGPHFDHYDVFLVQIRGNKLWHLDDGHHKDTDLSPSAAIRLLQDFQATEVVKQQPGDILYIPPGTGHWGVASNDSLTLSVGIRNPTLQEMISHLADRIGDELDTGLTLDDSLTTQGNGISEQITLTMRNKMADTMLNPSLLNQWFGVYMTELREPELISIPDHKLTDNDIIDKLESRQAIRCHLATRLAYQVTGDKLALYVNGESYSVSASDLSWLTPLEADRQVESHLLAITPDSIHVLSSLIHSGAVAFGPPGTNRR